MLTAVYCRFIPQTMYNNYIYLFPDCIHALIIIITLLLLILMRHVLMRDEGYFLM